MMNYPIPPEPEKDPGNYASCRSDIVIDVPAEDYFAWYLAEPAENFMLGTAIVSPLTETTPIDGPQWGEVGSARYIKFKDGTTALERITAQDFPWSYTYQPWAFTNPMRMLTDYAMATMTVEPVGDKTRVVWDYGFHARNGFALPLVKLFVKLDWMRNLCGALSVIKAHLETHGTGKTIHEVQDIKEAA